MPKAKKAKKTAPGVRLAGGAKLQRGLARRREVLGDAWVDQSLANTTDFTREFQSLITRYAWDEIWNRPELDAQTRRLLVLAFTLAQGRWEEFDLHFRAALEHGVPVAKLKEVLLQAAIYCGVPAANTAFKRAAALLAQRERAARD
jgi:3-oxoadipate enol-lactonase